MHLIGLIHILVLALLGVVQVRALGGVLGVVVVLLVVIVVKVIVLVVFGIAILYVIVVVVIVLAVVVLFVVVVLSGGNSIASLAPKFAERFLLNFTDKLEHFLSG